MGQLGKLPNIGDTLEDKLNQLGILTEDDLRKIGSKEVFKWLKARDEGACLNMLCALEGAVQGIRWHYLSEEEKEQLRQYFESLKT